MIRSSRLNEGNHPVRPDYTGEVHRNEQFIVFDDTQNVKTYLDELGKFTRDIKKAKIWNRQQVTDFIAGSENLNLRAEPLTYFSKEWNGHA